MSKSYLREKDSNTNWSKALLGKLEDELDSFAIGNLEDELE